MSLQDFYRIVDYAYISVWKFDNKECKHMYIGDIDKLPNSLMDEIIIKISAFDVQSYNIIIA